MYRADHASPGHAVKRMHLFGAVMFIEEDDRPPGIVTMTPVDLFHQSIELFIETTIVGNINPAGSADLHETEFPAQLGMQLQEPIHGTETLGNSLRVIDPIDTQQQELVAKLQPFA